MRTSTQRITPDMARVMLGSNKNNRKLRKHRVRQYAEEMLRGQWQVTGEAIKFAKDGSLLDGQHRLHAIVESGVTVEMLVVGDLDLSTFKVLDSGMTRRPVDVLRALGVTNGTQKAAAVRAYIAADAGIDVTNTHHLASLVTRTDVANFVIDNDELVNDAMRAATAAYNTCRGSRPSWGALYMLISKKHGQAEAEMFFRSIVDGSGLSDGDPRLTLRNWSVRHGSRTKSEHLASYVRAWNAYKDGEKMHILRLPKKLDHSTAYVVS
jgi:hypothetical protein